MTKPCKPKIGNITVTTKTKQLCAFNRKRKQLLVYNNGTATIEILSSQYAKYGDGIPVIAGATYTNKDYPQGRFWIVAESGTQDVRVEEDIEVETE